MSRIVIIGAGQAGGQAVASLRQLGCKEEIMLFGEEPHLPYQRPALSKQYLSGEHDEGRIFLRGEDFYKKQNITLRIGERIVSIDSQAKQIFTNQGEQIDYQSLILATGSRPRRLDVSGSNLDGIHYLRTLDDVKAIKKTLQNDNKIVIIGGGYIGLEVASVAVNAGMDVTVLETEDRILKRVTTPEMSEFYHKLHTDKGVKIELKSSVSSFEGNDTSSMLSCVVCKDKFLEADTAIVGIGVLPNIELASDAQIHCDNGITTDERCQTSVPDIYAIGDCANHPNPILRRRLRLESVPNAMDQAKVAAANIMGKNKTYSGVPWFWSDQYDLKLQMVGYSADSDTQVLRGDKDRQQFTIFYLKENRLVGVDAVNSARDFMMGRKFYGQLFDPLKLADMDIDVMDALIE